MTEKPITEEKNRILPSTLYLVATPIGNMSDLSERAKKVLSECDFIAAEDTRNSAKLLTIVGIQGKEMVSYHEHNKRASGERILARLLAGENCALVTDAGMPAISDPGEDLVRLCAANGVTVTVIPGASAVLTALALSALPTSRFVFEGFLPTEKAEKTARLTALSSESRTVILYEAPHRLVKTLTDLRDTLGGERRISLCRELTKRNEEILRTTLDGALSHYTQTEPRGEYVLVLEGCSPDALRSRNPLLSLSEEEHVAHYEREGMSRMDAIKAAARDRHMSKSQLYQILNKGR